MASRIVMSKLSPTMEEGRVLTWLKQEGDAVEVGDAVLEIETDKANMEVEATSSGVLRKILVAEGETVPTGTTLAVVAAADEEIADVLAEAEGSAAAEPAAEAPEPAAEAPEPAAETPEPAAEVPEPAAEAAPAAAAAPAVEAAAPPSAPTAGDGDRIKASPVARRMARAEGVELGRVSGTGPGGRIIKRDIEQAIRSGAAAAPAAVGPEVPFERAELSQVRKAIARNLVQSMGPIPHFFLTSEIDMGRVLQLRVELNEALEGSGVKIGVNDILIKVAAQALLEHPNVNVSFAEDHLRMYQRVDVGIAVAIPDGLITPVLRAADSKGLQRIAEDAKDLISRAREKKLKPEEYYGATFTISNLGPYGIDEFTAVINPPAATILAVGATKEKPVVVDGSIEVRSRMRVTLGCDHRAVDGAAGSEFLATFKNMLENPLRLVL